jgi:hypothetical protein
MLSFIFAITAMLNPTLCEYEDGSEMLGTDQSVCIWDASESGNNVGDSFIVFKTEQDTLIYLYEDGTLTD